MRAKQCDLTKARARTQKLQFIYSVRAAKIEDGDRAGHGDKAAPLSRSPPTPGAVQLEPAPGSDGGASNIADSARDEVRLRVARALLPNGRLPQHKTRGRPEVYGSPARTTLTKIWSVRSASPPEPFAPKPSAATPIATLTHGTVTPHGYPPGSPSGRGTATAARLPPAFGVATIDTGHFDLVAGEKGTAKNWMADNGVWP